MAWTPLPPAAPQRGWWTDRESAAQYEIRRWVEERLEQRARAAAIARLKRKALMAEARAAAATVWRYEPKVEPLPPGWCLAWDETKGCYARSPDGTRYRA